MVYCLLSDIQLGNKEEICSIIFNYIYKISKTIKCVLNIFVIGAELITRSQLLAFTL